MKHLIIIGMCMILFGCEKETCTIPQGDWNISMEENKSQDIDRCYIRVNREMMYIAKGVGIDYVTVTVNYTESNKFFVNGTNFNATMDYLDVNATIDLLYDDNYSLYQKNVTAIKLWKYDYNASMVCYGHYNLISKTEKITKCWINTWYDIDYIMTDILVNNNTPEFNYLFDWCMVYPELSSGDCSNYTGYDHLSVGNVTIGDIAVNNFTWKDYRTMKR